MNRKLVVLLVAFLTLAPLRRALRELQGHSRDLLGHPNPNLTAIGENQLRIQALKERIREAEENCRLEFEMLLTLEQKETYARIRRRARSARRYERIIPAFKDTGLL